MIPCTHVAASVRLVRATGAPSAGELASGVIGSTAVAYRPGDGGVA